MDELGHAFVARNLCHVPRAGFLRTVKRLLALLIENTNQIDTTPGTIERALNRGNVADIGLDQLDLTDIAGEFTMTMANRQLADDLETVFLMADARFAHVSSSLIKQVAPLADETQLARFVPEDIVPILRKKLEAAMTN